jgi:CheY-like chemotaxis protein
LVIETRNATGSEAGLADGGDFVLISVSDTGLGMTEDVAERAFEPFFTTKAPGRGTGLGLSSVYGFVEQSAGHATIRSEVGHGTTVNLFLPRANAPSEPLKPDAAEDVPLSENAESILVVEDNPDVRELTLQRVEGLGYVVHEAENGAAAIRVLESGTPVDLVLSDVVMPGGMSGYDLAHWIAAHRPAVKVVLTSGYTAEERSRDPVQETGHPILRKPYKRLDLAVALHEALKS